MSLLSTQEDLLDSVLGSVPVGQIVTIKPLSEDFCHVLGYLLTWKLILTFFKASSSQVSEYGATFDSPVLRKFTSFKNQGLEKELQSITYVVQGVIPKC